MEITKVMETVGTLENVWSKAKIILKSVKPLNQKPGFVQIDGFWVTTSKGDNVFFDWSSTSGNSTITEDGHCIMEWELNDFSDTECFIKEGDTKIDWEEVVAGEIDEIHYEIREYDLVLEDETFYDFECLKFDIEVYSETELVKTLSFTEEQLKRYEEKVEKERILPETNTIEIKDGAQVILVNGKSFMFNSAEELVEHLEHKSQTIWRVQEDDVRMQIENCIEAENLSQKEVEQIVQKFHRGFSMDRWDEQVDIMIGMYIDEIKDEERKTN